MLPGIMVSESSGSGAVVSDTETVALPLTTEPSLFVSNAVIVLVPTDPPETRPLELTAATDGMLEFQVIFGELVTFSRSPYYPKWRVR